VRNLSRSGEVGASASVSPHVHVCRLCTDSCQWCSQPAPNMSAVSKQHSCRYERIHMMHDLSNMFLLFSRNVFLIVNLHFIQFVSVVHGVLWSWHLYFYC